jgi:Flp pilus assembly protein TadG
MLDAPGRSLSSWVRCVVGLESGGALVELAVCLPLLALILVGTADFARIFYTTIALTNAARAGAQYGAYSLAQSGQVAEMQLAATNAVNISFDPPQASNLCQCADDTGAFSATSPTPNNCTVDVATACPGALHRVITVTVTATKSFTTISNLLGVPCRLAVGGCSVTRSATLRVSE